MADVEQSSAKPVSPDSPEKCVESQLITEDEPLELPVDDDLSLAELIESELAARSSKVHESTPSDEILSPDAPMFDDGHDLDPAEIFDPGSPESDSQAETPETESSSQGGNFRQPESRVSTMFTTTKDSPDGAVAAATAAFLLAERDNLGLPSFDPFSTIEADDDCFSPDRPIQGSIGQPIPEIGIISPDDDSGSYSHLDSFVDPPEIIEEFIESERKHTNMTTEMITNDSINGKEEEVTDLDYDEISPKEIETSPPIDDKNLEETSDTPQNVENEEDINNRTTQDIYEENHLNEDQIIEEKIQNTEEIDESLCMAANNEIDLVAYESVIEVDTSSHIDGNNLIEELSCGKPELCSEINQENIPKIEEKNILSEEFMNGHIEEEDDEQETVRRAISEDHDENTSLITYEEQIIEQLTNHKEDIFVNETGHCPEDGLQNIRNDPILDENHSESDDKINHSSSGDGLDHHPDREAVQHPDDSDDGLREDVLNNDEEPNPDLALPTNQHDQVETSSCSSDDCSVPDDLDNLAVNGVQQAPKKKKKTDGGEKKKSKKKRGDCEKENISVVSNGHPATAPESASAAALADADELINVNVKALKNCYSDVAFRPSRERARREIDQDILHCGSIQSLRQTYCSQVARSRASSSDRNDNRLPIATGVDIKHLRRSFGDLSSCCDAESPATNGDDDPRASYCSLVGLSAGDSTDSSCPGSPFKKSSFSKFDQLSKKTVLHVRSVDAGKVQKQFNQSSGGGTGEPAACRSCGKQVFQMEQVKAERAVWHKNCFRCAQCNKQLTVDIYQSHEGTLYCKPHFRELFKPKAVVEQEEAPIRLRRPEMIIRENQPLELPPDVVRASDKPDLGLEELASLNVKSRFQVFEQTTEKSDLDRSPSAVSVKRSPSILSKLAKFQARGMDVGVTDDSLNGVPVEGSTSSSEEESDDEEEADGVVKAAKRGIRREKPARLANMDDVKSRWEKREEAREERKQEIQQIRSRLFHGHQGKMKELYEQAVQESERPSRGRDLEDCPAPTVAAKSLKERFERGEVTSAGQEESDELTKEEERAVIEAGLSKKSRSLFLELDASAVKTAQTKPISPTPPITKQKVPVTPVSRQQSEDVVRSSDVIEDVRVETADVSSKFKFFEKYQEPERQRKQFRITPPRDGQVKDSSPDREIYRDPDIVRGDDPQEDDEAAVRRSQTASKMLSLFRQMEENAGRDTPQDGPKPLKRFTPPPEDYKQESSSESESEEDEEDEEEDEPERPEDELLKQTREAARAKCLRAKFERWEAQENEANQTNQSGRAELLDTENASLETAKSLRARFESLQSEAQQQREPKTSRPKVNRFVELQSSCVELCSACDLKVYPLERAEIGGKIFHKKCFRCLQCNCILRMETYTLNSGKLYCIPHFKQLFISKGNYDEGFGLDQHKRKWNNRSTQQLILENLSPNENTP